MNKLLEKIKKYKAKNDYLNYGRDIIAKWVNDFSKKGDNKKVKILDIGCGSGDDLINIKNILVKNNIDSKLHGVEIYKDYSDSAKDKGIEVISIDIEKEKIPFTDGDFDIIIINQVLEHAKEIFWILSQANRVLKKQGLLIIGVPNLAAWHNRILLLFGRQPSCIKVLSAHVRGFTKKNLVQALVKYGGFTLLNYAAANFYPFPPKVARFLSRLLPSLAVTSFLAFLKNDQDNFSDFLNSYIETNYRI